MKIIIGLSLSALASLSLTATGCSKEEGPSCGQAAAHFMAILDAELARDGDPERLEAGRTHRPALQDALLKGCEKQKWSLSAKQCVLNAKTVADAKTCAPTSEPSGAAAAAE